jgi:dCTP deaminase
MSVLSGKAIKASLDKGEISIEPFDDPKLQPASYDLTLGSVLLAGTGRVDLSGSADFVLESNTWASIASREVIGLPNNITARYGIPSSLARRGVISFGGPQIDPGYRGKLFVSVYNPTLEPINLRFGQDFFTVIFEDVGGECEGYAGTYQDQKDFPSADVEMMMRMKSKNLSDVIDRVETLDGSVANLAQNMDILAKSVSSINQDVHSLKEAVRRYEPYVRIFGFIVGIAATAWIGQFALSLFDPGKP